MRLFQREFQQCGALFIFNGQDYIKDDDEFTNQRMLPKNHQRTAHADKVMVAAG